MSKEIERLEQVILDVYDRIKGRLVGRETGYIEESERLFGNLFGTEHQLVSSILEESPTYTRILREGYEVRIAYVKAVNERADTAKENF